LRHFEWRDRVSCAWSISTAIGATSYVRASAVVNRKSTSTAFEERLR